MEKINILDCTLRDGGYENFWKFGFDNIQSIIRNLTETNVEYIEIGFLQNDVKGQDYTIFDSCKSIKELCLSKTKKSKLAVMIKNGDYEISSLEQNIGESIDLVRVSFHEYDMMEAINNIKIIKEKGYDVSCNPINVVGYSCDNLIKLLNEINEIKPKTSCIVDTFGILMPKKLQDILSIIDNYLDDSICVGIHLHNNLMMAFSLAISFLDWNKMKYKCIIDSCIGGIGRAPGNLQTELIMDFINEQYGEKYVINPIYEIMDNYLNTINEVENIKKRMAYQLSAKYMIHRNYSEFFMDRQGISLSNLNKYLCVIEDDQKKVFNKEYAEVIRKKVLGYRFENS